ncbi:PEP-CTERM sorting domain-containing protein [Paraglaciecola marina]|uniref:PEP-CTERM sorting domain-containing protein n=1 Tax=Paraglaciecola marina TaxID=2500157 RepID=UPI001060F4E0|nr:PEP-CTERM sorting domain-containing protein [Paraglaciecola marina]
MKSKLLYSFLAGVSFLFAASTQATLINSITGDLVTDYNQTSDVVLDLEGTTLKGAYNVNVANSLYNVVFEDLVLSTLDTSLFTQEEAELISNTLLSDLFFDAMEDLFVNVNGCYGYCRIFTVFDIDGNNSAGYYLENNASQENSSSVLYLSSSTDSTDANYATTATWTIQTSEATAEVPAPAALLLVLIGIAGIAFSRRRALR